MAKKVVIIFLMLVFVFSAAPLANAADSHAVVINVHNTLPLPAYKEVTISANIPKLSTRDKIALFSKGNEVPIQILSVRNNTVRFRVALSFAPNETKILVLKYGKNIKNLNREEVIYKPSFSGTYFVGIGSGSLYIISLSDKNNVVVKTNSGNILFSGTLNKKEYKIIPLSRDEVFTVQSDAPIFAEVSSLKKNCLGNSSDDVSSVFGTYFILYIPKEIVVSSYTQTKLAIKTLSGKSIYNGVLQARGQYRNLSLSPGFYEIFADHPVTIQFGCEDDNIYSINYGSSTEFKGVSYGNIVCSALFPNTSVKIKTPDKIYPAVNLETPGDYTYKNLITKYKDNYTETIPVFIQYSKPVLIYSDSNHGNIGGEQIPSLFGQNEHFIFLTGKIFNFDGLVHQRKVVIIPKMPDTTIRLNGKEYTLNSSLMPKTFLFKKSYTPVKIDSNKPISVFEAGITTSIEFLSMLLPFNDSSITYSLGASPPVQGNANKTDNNDSNSVNSVISKYLMPVAGFFNSMWTGLEKNAWFKNTTDTLTQFWRTISPSLNNLSRQIIALFIPVAQMVYPYVHPYFANLTVSELAAILFYILLALIIILLIPKRRKKNLPVEKVTETELKKKKVAFNVKTIEEKGMGGIKIAPPGKPKSLSPKHAKPRTSAATSKTSVANIKRKSIAANKSVKKAKISAQSETASPLGIFKKKTVDHNEIKEVPKKEPVKKINNTTPLPVKEAAESTKKVLETQPEEVESEELRRKKALEKILHKNHVEVSESKAQKGAVKETVPHKEKSVPVTKQQSEFDRVAEVLKKLKETTAKVVEQSQQQEKQEPDISVEKTAKDKEETSEELSMIENSQQKEAVKEKKEIDEETIQKVTPKEASNKRRILGLGALHRKRLETASKETTPKEITSEEANAVKNVKEDKEKVSPQLIKQTPSEEEKLHEKAKKEISGEETVHSSLSDLLERVRKETPNKKIISNIPEGSNEALIKKTEEVAKPKAPAISGSVVLDSKSLSELYKKHVLEHLNRIMMSAKEQANVDPDVKSKYRVSVISLTAIEMRIAEDLARRIGAKKITGELILIAKKTRISTIIVDDKPKITNYQGIKILNIDEVLSEE